MRAPEHISQHVQTTGDVDVRHTKSLMLKTS